MDIHWQNKRIFDEKRCVVKRKKAESLIVQLPAFFSVAA